GPVIDVPDAAKHLAAARELSQAVFYWLQTEAPRPDGGTGFRGLRLRGDLLGSADGLAQAPYIRESRRIKAAYTIVEQDLSVAVRGSRGAVAYDDSVGIGMYRIDLHPSTGGDNYIDVASSPFRIPLGAMIPQRVQNLLPASKNLGTTHITNGCYRLHPVEWNIGEAAGLLAGFCLDRGVSPHAVHATPALLGEFQDRLVAQGIELAWPAIEGY
ncbi:FAD-dependent oxidoreductase, partial [Kribbella sp.]|uniref:FAD-dependent oxidoreductase n=1 Tax=Kribbella sp. TaxID=1871183 RepID=UPI002D2744C8